MWFMQNALAKPDNAGAAATDYMHLFGLVAMGYMWARMAKVAQDKIAATRRDAVSRRQAGDRPLLHGADDAGDRTFVSRASRPAADHDGDAGGSVLSSFRRFSRPQSPWNIMILIPGGRHA